MDSQVKAKAFILMPSGGHGEYEGGTDEAKFIYDGIICPALQRAYGNNIQPLREMDNRNPGAITRHIVQHIAEADICIVDLTGQNPNVFLELGIRYGLRRATTILLKQPKTTIPFDIAGYRCVEYFPRFHGFSRNAATFETMTDIFLWSQPLFQFSKEKMIEMHGSKRFLLPYNKELRST
jgi:hypothetical protein